MSSQSGRFIRLATLALLYFVQGAPYGFQTSCLPIILRESGLSFTALGVMKLLFIPWVCKPIYAPFIEQTKTKSWWLTTCMLALGFTCILSAFLTESNDILAISFLMFLLNLFSAGQDVATDSLAVMILNSDELGAGNTVQVVAYKAGSVVAGGLLLWSQKLLGWNGMFFGFASIYFLGLILLKQLNLVENSSKHIKRNKESNNDDSKDSSSTSNLIKIAKNVFSVNGTIYLTFFISFYKLCERAEQSFALFMVDKKVPRSELALWSTIMRSLSIAGSTYSGYLLSNPKHNVKDILINYSALRVIPIVLQFILLRIWATLALPNNPEEAYFSLTIDSLMMYGGFVCTSLTLFCAGVITTAAFTLMMRLSQTAPQNIQGTHYTTLATFEVLGKLAFATISGALIDLLGLEFMFFIFVILAILCLPFLYLMPSSFHSLFHNSNHKS